MNPRRATKDEVDNFLIKLQEIISSEEFDAKKQFYLPQTQKNYNTLFELDYDIYDVIDELKKLQVTNYYQTLPDDKNSNMPDFHVFFIRIGEKEIYIKIRIQKTNNVFCISFHFAQYSHGEFIYE